MPVFRDTFPESVKYFLYDMKDALFFYVIGYTLKVETYELLSLVNTV
ncbi:hypothetical protein MTBBW1_1010016 [Desulfamplus magnetovallimortis]|uniref:Uncharacterized protein n=1 Tax=Desulfamplus magnetovallimortis TaxID=1246637 RepID=A0A1W1H526_9BACT|nr:hypothetical protein MTBBW1_1010016 [Desulfamplus magnetovallimortis]